MKKDYWPPIEGRYKIGKKDSPVAVCTLASIDEIEIDLNKVAIIGKCVTENIGIEKIVQNIISNPNIRYLILCGRESKGHFVSQAIESLKENGVDKEKRIIGAKGNMPYLRNIGEELIERFRKQIILINLVGETNSQKIGKVIDEILEKKPSEFKAEKIEIKKIPEIIAAKANWVPDPNGYFTVTIDKGRKKIIVEHFQNGKLNKRISGSDAKEICDTVAKLNLIGEFEQKLEHAMYLARELKKAEIALNQNLDYEQDQELKFEKVKKEKGPTDEYGWFD